MAWQLTIEYDTGPDFSFAVEPITTPKYEHVYNMSVDPPVIAEIKETWQIKQAWFLPSPDTASMIDAFNTLKGNLQDTTDKINGVLLELDSVEKFAMRATTHHEFRLEDIILDDFDAAGGTSFLRFSMTVVGVQRLLTDAVNMVSTIEQSLDRSFDGDFETRTLRTTIKTVKGTSATTAAQVLGLLALPGAAWAFVTVSQDDANVNISVKDQTGDTHVEATCTIREQGIALPAGTFVFERTETTTREGFDTELQIDVRAVGPQALAVVQAEEPVGARRASIREVQHKKEAVGSFLVAKPKSGSVEPFVITRRRSISIGGGGQPRTYQPIMRQRKQWTTVGPFQALIVTEEISVSTRRPQSLKTIKLEKLLFPKNFDGAQSSETLPQKVEDATSPSGERWERRATRVYVFTDENIPTPSSILTVLLKLQGLQSEADYQITSKGATG